MSVFVVSAQPYRGGFLTWIGSMLLVPAGWAFGQGHLNPVLLETGGGQPLVSVSLPVPAFPDSTLAPLEFRFAFGTDEVFSPGSIFDSFTITLQDDAKTLTLLLLTADASGVIWAPATPGAIALDPDSIARSAANYPSGQPVFVRQASFQVTVPVPSQYQGRSATLFLDLFDNQNSIPSQGYFHLVNVPEPASWATGLGGALCWLVLRRRRRK